MTDINSQACYQFVKRACDSSRVDPTRPGFHFTPPAMWMNDPNGALEIDGWRHIFYLHDPFSADGKSAATLPDGRIISGDKKPNRVWGHTKTRDFVNWIHYPPALVPNREAGELKSISGSSILLPDGTPVIMYTSMADDFSCCQRIAVSKCGMDSFQPLMQPAITQKMRGSQKMDNEFRDPFLLKHNNIYYAIVAAQMERTNGKYSVLALYRAEDKLLTQWQYQGILLERPATEIPYFECPKFFMLNSKWVLIFSPYGPPRYFVGELDLHNCMFSVEFEGYVDHTPYAYATTSLQTESGETYLLSWIPGWNKECYVSRQWGGCLSIPHKLNLSSKLELIQTPASELDTLQFGAREATQGMLLRQNLGWKMEIKALEDVGSIYLTDQAASPVWEMHWNGKTLCVNGISTVFSGKGNVILYVDRTIWELFAEDGLCCFSGILPACGQLGIHYSGCGTVPVLWNVQNINISFI